MPLIIKLHPDKLSDKMILAKFPPKELEKDSKLILDITSKHKKETVPNFDDGDKKIIKEIYKKYKEFIVKNN